jgi:hypothetical protein
MKKTTLFVACLLCATCLSAQESKSPPFKNDIGFNTTFALENLITSAVTPFTFMYKRYRKENVANRLGASLSLSINEKQPDDNSGNASENSFASFSISIGREKQSSFHKNWIVFYGGDLVPYYNTSGATYYYNYAKTERNQYTYFGIGARPFLGIRYAVHPRLYLSAEASFNLSYGYSSMFKKSYNPDVTNQDSNGNSYSFYARPASGLFLYYRF